MRQQFALSLFVFDNRNLVSQNDSKVMQSDDLQNSQKALNIWDTLVRTFIAQNIQNTQSGHTESNRAK